MIREIQFSPSTFILDNDDTHLFSKSTQDDYRKKSAAAIGRALKKVEVCEKTQEKLSALFFELLTDFGAARKEINESHNTDDAKGFGVRRDGFFSEYSTCLDDVYKPYNARILKEFRELLDPYAEELENRTHEKIKVIAKDRFQELESSFEIEVFDEDEIAELNNIKPIIFPEGFPEDLLTAKKLEPEKLEILRKAFEELYNCQYDKLTKVDLVNYIKILHKKYPYIQKRGWGRMIQNDGNIKSFYALATARFTVDGKSTSVSQYLVWLHRDGTMHPLDRMQWHTICTVIHQPTCLIDSTLKVASLFFAKAILWNRQEVKELKEYVGLLRAYFAHACCFERGSSAVGEYFETMLYHYQGFCLHYSNKKLVDLEAFTTPLLSQFMANYDSMIRLEIYA